MSFLITNRKYACASNKVDSCVCHTEAAAPLGAERGGGALDTKDLVSPFLLAAFYRLRHHSLFSRTQQPVFHQTLPWATQIRSGKVGGSGRRGVVPPDGVARGKHRDPVVPERRAGLWGRRQRKPERSTTSLRTSHRPWRSPDHQHLSRRASSSEHLLSFSSCLAMLAPPSLRSSQ